MINKMTPLFVKSANVQIAQGNGKYGSMPQSGIAPHSIMPYGALSRSSSICFANLHSTLDKESFEEIQ